LVETGAGFGQSAGASESVKSGKFRAEDLGFPVSRRRPAASGEITGRKTQSKPDNESKAVQARGEYPEC